MRQASGRPLLLRLSYAAFLNDGRGFAKQQSHLQLT
jgi:hypothetical protein